MNIDMSCVFLIAAFVLGYIAGRVDLLVKLQQPAPSLPAGFFAKNENQTRRQSKDTNEPPRVMVDDIDTSLYVGAVSTDNLLKTGNTKLGTTSVTTDNINQSVSKLAQLKSR